MGDILDNYKGVFKKFFFGLQGFILAIFTVIIFSCLFFRVTICNSNYHKNLYIKHNIGLNIYNYVNSTIDSLFEDTLSNSTDTFTADLAKTIKSSVSLKFVSLNLENIQNDIFKYFNGEKEFLPDISFSSIGNSQEIEKLAQNITSSDFKTLKSVNLGTIFETFNLGQISTILFIIKFAFWVIKSLPPYLLLFMLLISFFCILLTNNSSQIKYMLKCYTIFCFVFFVILGFVVALIPYTLLKKNMFLPNTFDKNLVALFYSYAKDLFLPIIIMFFVASIFSIFTIIISNKLLPYILKRLDNLYICNKLANFSNSLFYSISFLILIICIGYKTSTLKSMILFNNFDSLISSKQVVIAKDDTLYAVQILVLDAKTKMPLPDIAISLTGIANDGTYFNTMSRTNSDGTLSFDVSKGHFHVDFVSDLFPPEYVLPKRSHITFDTAKTIVLPFKLKYIQNTSKKSDLGSVSVSILDSSNLPYPNIKLCFTQKDNPFNKEYIITNSDGIATFQGTASDYTVSFCKSRFPSNHYNIPDDFDLTLENGTFSRYTIKLVPNTE